MGTWAQNRLCACMQAVVLMISQGQTGASILEALPEDVGRHVFESARKHIEQPEDYVIVSMFQKQVRSLHNSRGSQKAGMEGRVLRKVPKR